MREAVGTGRQGGYGGELYGGNGSSAQGKGLVLTGGEVRVEALLEIVIHKFKDEVETRRLRDDLRRGRGRGRVRGREARGVRGYI